MWFYWTPGAYLGASILIASVAVGATLWWITPR